jgi:hypothetical protein
LPGLLVQPVRRDGLAFGGTLGQAVKLRAEDFRSLGFQAALPPSFGRLNVLRKEVRDLVPKLVG